MGVCSVWANPEDVLCGPCADYEFDPALLDQMLRVASDVLYEFTGRRWPGECADIVRPCSPSAGCAWTQWPRQGQVATCGCGSLSEVRLGRPVTAITEVKVDGDIVDPSEYRVDDGDLLVALGDRRWPVCQSLRLSDDEDGTWSVAYTYGAAPPEAGVVAAARLGCQLALACDPNSEGCQLPERVTSITREGVTMALLDPLTLFAEGRTGLADVDLWVASTFKGAARRRARVTVPDAAPRFRRVP